MACSHCTGPGTGQGMGNDGFLYYAMYCTHYTGTGTGNHCFLLCPSQSLSLSRSRSRAVCIAIMNTLRVLHIEENAPSVVTLGQYPKKKLTKSQCFKDFRSMLVMVSICAGPGGPVLPAFTRLLKKI